MRRLALIASLMPALALALVSGCKGGDDGKICGDGTVNATVGEQCDDGNTVGGDGCSAQCMLEYCGNGTKEETEVCDDGNNRSADGCSGDCQSDETCGNGVWDPPVGEACDDGNHDDGDGCQHDCSLPGCGDGFLDPNEACDDGNRDSGDGCNANCTSDETCGNGIKDQAEGCDDGNTEDGDGCSSLCAGESCGNNVLDPHEVCDDGNNVSGDGCNATCISDETCGNGIVDVNETCEDGNTLDGDGCSSTCRLDGALLYSQDFPFGNVLATDPQCVEWNVFRADLVGLFSAVTISGSNDTVGVTCSDPTAATTLCNALNTGTPALNVSCSGRTWNVGTCGSGMEINSTGTSVCSCVNPGYVVRPCIGNNNWGGINTTTCSAPAQTMEVLCAR